MRSCRFVQLSFDTREVVLPAVPLGITSRAVFHVINTGYDFLELRHRIPPDAGPSQVRVCICHCFDPCVISCIN